MKSETTPVATSYRQRIDRAMAGRDALDVMAAMPALLEAIVRDHSVEILRARPFESKWTPCEILGHVADCELIFGSRLRLTLWENEPTLPGFEENQWVRAQQQNDISPELWVMRFRMLREMNMSVWRLVRDEDWSRAGMHSERGRETLADLRQMIAGHDLIHLDQLSRYVAAVESNTHFHYFSGVSQDAVQMDLMSSGVRER